MANDEQGQSWLAGEYTGPKIQLAPIARIASQVREHAYKYMERFAERPDSLTVLVGMDVWRDLRKDMGSEPWSWMMRFPALTWAPPHRRRPGQPEADGAMELLVGGSVVVRIVRLDPDYLEPKHWRVVHDFGVGGEIE